MGLDDDHLTPVRIAKAITLVQAALPATAKLDADAVEATAESWSFFLEDVTGAELSAALKRHVCLSKWFPSVAEIRAIVDESRNGRRRTGLDAWGDVKRAVSSTGRYRRPAFADPLVARCVEAIGWQAICDSEDEMVERAHFVRAYDSMATGAAEDRSVASLPGVARPALPSSDAAALVGSLARRLTGGAS